MSPALEAGSLDHQGSPFRALLICWWLLRVRGYAFLVGGLWHWSPWRPSGQWGGGVAYGEATGTLDLLPMRKSWRGPPSPSIPGSMVPPPQPGL